MLKTINKRDLSISKYFLVTKLTLLFTLNLFPTYVLGAQQIIVPANATQTIPGTYTPGSFNRGSIAANGTLTNNGTLNNNTGGTINIGTGGSSGTLVGNITNNGSLVFNRSNDSTYAGIISGSGTVTKSGAGTLTVSGINIYTGTTTVGSEPYC